MLAGLKTSYALQLTENHQVAVLYLCAQAELATFDVCLKKAQSNDSHMSAPIGVPKSHWWYQQAAKAQQVVS